MTPWLALCVALAVDGWLGEPPARLHPVVAMGRWLGWAGRWIAPAVVSGAPPVAGAADAAAEVAQPAAADWPRFFAGALAWSLGAIAVTALAVVAERALFALAAPLAVLGLGLLLKPMLAWAMLRDEVLAVEAALATSPDAGRARLARLVSRDVATLDDAAVREAAIETLAENLNDSVVAPLFWFCVAGLPGAALYRYANTADAMWGYRGARHGRDWTWAGKWAARADDAASWLPARLTAALLCAVAPAAARPRHAELARQARVTPSPNGGWPMGAMALALGLRLGKPGVYMLNPAGRAPAPADIARACRLAGRVLLTLPPLAGAGLALGALLQGLADHA
ncbi:CobD/CbiB family cobalamin biosynthesis protein [Derxia lacustris]|uniref:CobD/CbiB family cobalamin biosynthesis protein n=1 Tax=Derxia lacustris TaxID=764842 RepID=UPI000A16CE71|nr:CobD/CbiB family cobalamin biosynthesis protein [Derxia lacustris]